MSSKKTPKTKQKNPLGVLTEPNDLVFRKNKRTDPWETPVRLCGDSTKHLHSTLQDYYNNSECGRSDWMGKVSSLTLELGCCTSL